MTRRSTREDGSPVVVFRADASAAIGAGHIYRCLSLSDELRKRNWHCILLSSPEVHRMISAERLAAMEVVEIDTEAGFDTDLCVAAVGGAADMIVVDHYKATSDYEKGCRAWCRVVMAIDDMPGRMHDCDILLDQTYGRRAEEYRPFVPDGAAVCAGTNFALLAGAFVDERPASINRRGKTAAAGRVFIGIGATDLMGLTGRAVDEILAERQDVSIVVVVSSAAASFPALKALAASRSNVTLLADVTPATVAKEMAKADVAVGAAGTGTWERCCLGLPSAMIVVADNQEDIAKAVVAAGAAEIPGRAENLAPGDIGRAVARLLADRDRRETMSMKAAAICDGLGAARVADVISLRMHAAAR